MGEHQNPNINIDPAIQRWANMHANRFKYFRWTPRTVRITLIYTVLVPSLFGYMAYKTDGKWDLRAKRKGDDPREY